MVEPKRDKFEAPSASYWCQCGNSTTLGWLRNHPDACVQNGQQRRHLSQKGRGIAQMLRYHDCSASCLPTSEQSKDLK